MTQAAEKIRHIQGQRTAGWSLPDELEDLIRKMNVAPAIEFAEGSDALLQSAFSQNCLITLAQDVSVVGEDVRIAVSCIGDRSRLFRHEADPIVVVSGNLLRFLNRIDEGVK